MDVKEQRRFARELPAAPAWDRPGEGALTTRGIADLLVPAATMVLLFVGAFVLAALNEHPIIQSLASPVRAWVVPVVPAAIAITTVLAVYRPWLGLLAMLALTPVVNTAVMYLMIGEVQIIPQTVFAAALVIGCVRQARAKRVDRLHAIESWIWGPEVPAGEAVRWHQRIRVPRPVRVVEIAVLGFAALAVASTIASPNQSDSFNVLLHGILEPIVLGAVLVWLGPSPRGLIVVAGTLAVQTALGSFINIAQDVWTYGPSLNEFNVHRLYFAAATYVNVGLFGVIIATVLPMLAAVLLLRRDLGVPRWASALFAVAGMLTLAGLFFTLSKSAWVASAGALTLLLMLLMHTWRRRIAMSLAVVAISAAFIPWPTLVLQAVPSFNSAYRNAVVAMVGQPRFDSWNPTTGAGRGSMTERYYAIEGGVHMAVDHPIFGVGLDQFRRYYIMKGYRPAGAKDVLDHAHSLFPEVAAELGIPALLLLGAALGAALLALRQVYHAARDNVSRTMAAMLIAALAAWVVAATAFGDDIYRVARGQAADGVTLAVVLAMAIALSRWTHRPLGGYRFYGFVPAPVTDVLGGLRARGLR